MGIVTNYKFRAALSKDSLIIIKPALKLGSWTLHSGSVYKQTVTRGEPVKVTRDGVQLTLVGSIAAVTATTEYYYASGIIYVYLPTTDYFSYYFSLYYGSRGFKLPKDLNLTGSAEIVYFEPRIIGNPSNSRDQKRKMQGIAIASDANFSLIDVEQDYMEDLGELIENTSYSFNNKEVEIYRYLSEEATPEVHKIFKGQIYSWSKDRKTIQFSCKDFVKRLESAVQTTEYDTTTYPNMNPEYVGKVIRTIYGIVYVDAVCINNFEDDSPATTDNRQWKLSWHPNLSVDEIWIQDKKITTNYTLNGDKNEITFDSGLEAAYSLTTLQGNEKVSVKVQGKFSGASLIDNASDIVKEILLAVGYTTSDLNTTSFTDAASDNTYDISFAMPRSLIESRPTARDVISEINKSVLGFLSLDENFLIRYDIFQTRTTDIDLDKDIDVQSRTRNADTSDLASKIVIAYNYSERTENWTTVTKQDDDALYLQENKKSHTIESVLSNSTDANALATSYLSYYKNPIILEEFTLKLQLDDKIMGDFIKIDGKTCEILNLSKTIKDTRVVARRI